MRGLRRGHPAGRMIMVCCALGFLGGCAASGVGTARQDDLRLAVGGPAEPGGVAKEKPATVEAVALKPSGGTFLVPVTINNTVEMQFIVDSGASDVSIPADVVSVLMQTGTISDADFLGKRVYRLADGSTVPTPIFRIRSIRVGDRVLHDVTGSIALGSGGLLLGQSFLGRLRSWSIDNDRQLLVLN